MYVNLYKGSEINFSPFSHYLSEKLLRRLLNDHLTVIKSAHQIFNDSHKRKTCSNDHDKIKKSLNLKSKFTDNEKDVIDDYCSLRFC